MAFVYYQLSWILYVLHPAWSYELNVDLEDHAEHEYMAFVQEHPELASQSFDSTFASDYGPFESLADLFRQIGYDERAHKEESLRRTTEARFS